MGAAKIVAAIILLASAPIALAVSPAVKTMLNGPCYGISPSNSTVTSGFDPNNPKASGYILVFDSEFNDMGDVDTSCPSPPSDTGCTNPPGRNWYLNNWSFPNTATTPGTDINFVAPPFPSKKTTVLHIHALQRTGNWAMSSMGISAGASHGPASWQQGWNGRLFTGGWYMEARFSTEWQTCVGTPPNCIANGTVVAAPGSSNGHVSIWATASDRFILSVNRWAEDDNMDGNYGGSFYLTTLLDWASPGGSTGATNGNGCIGSFNLVNITACVGLPVGYVDRTSVHTYGQLWVPATATVQGYLQQFVDGIPSGTFRWNQYSGLAASGDNIASIIDQDHMQMNIGNDVRHTEDTTAATSESWWDWVHVWQLPAAAAASGNAQVTPQPNFTGGNGSCWGGNSG